MREAARLDKVSAAANAVLVKEKPKKWAPKAFKYYYIPATPIGVAGIVMDPTEDLHWLQDELIKAVEPYAVTFQGSRNDRFGSLGSEYAAIGCTGFSAPSGRPCATCSRRALRFERIGKRFEVGGDS